MLTKIWNCVAVSLVPRSREKAWRYVALELDIVFYSVIMLARNFSGSY